MSTTSQNAVQNKVVTGELNSVKETLTNNVNVNGSKNVCPLMVGNQTVRGITITDSADGTYKVLNGTSTGNPLIVSLLDELVVYPNNGDFLGYTALTPEQLGIDRSKTYVFARDSYNNVRQRLALYLNDGTSVATLDIGSDSAVNSIEIDFSQYTFDRIGIFLLLGNNNAYSNYALKPILMLKSDWQTNNAYVPWAKTNRALTDDVVGLLENVNKRGSKNIFDFNTRVISSTPVTINSDGSSIRVYYDSASSWRNAQFLVDVEPNTEYRVVTEAIYTSGYGSVEIATEDDTVTIASISGTVITANRVINGTFNSGDRSRIRLKLVASGSVAVVPDITFKNTMICLASNTDLTWEPYSKSNKELTEDVGNLEANKQPRFTCSDGNCNSCRITFTNGHGGVNGSRALVIASGGFIALGFWGGAWQVAWKNSSGVTATNSNNSASGITLTFSEATSVDVLPIYDADGCVITKIT